MSQEKTCIHNLLSETQSQGDTVDNINQMRKSTYCTVETWRE